MEAYAKFLRRMRPLECPANWFLPVWPIDSDCEGFAEWSTRSGCGFLGVIVLNRWRGRLGTSGDGRASPEHVKEVLEAGTTCH